MSYLKMVIVLVGVALVVLVGYKIIHYAKIPVVEEIPLVVMRDDLQEDRMAYTYETPYEHRSYMEQFVWGNGSISYLDRGALTGEVIVLLHGTPTSSRMYRSVIRGLIDRGYRVIVPDMPWYGLTAQLQLTDPSIQTYTTALSMLLTHVGVDQYVLAGHDIGTLWMRNTALRLPQAVTHLIVFNGLVTESAFTPPLWFEHPTIVSKLLTRAVRSSFLSKQLMKQILRGGGVTAKLFSPETIEGYVLPFLAWAKYSYMYFVSTMSDTYEFLDILESNIPKLAGIRTMVLRGTQDTVLQAETALPFLEKHLSLSQRDIHLFEDAGHYLIEQKPDEIVQHIDAFLKTYYDEERTKNTEQWIRRNPWPEMEINPTEEL